MPANNQVHVRGEVAERPYFDLVPARRSNGSDRIAFLRVLIWVPRDDDQPQPEDRLPADQVRVVAYGKLAEALRNKVRTGDVVVVRGWIQTRKRPNNGGTVTEIVANEIDHFMRPLLPGGPIMRQIMRVADERQLSDRFVLDKLLAFGLSTLALATFEPRLRALADLAAANNDPEAAMLGRHLADLLAAHTWPQGAAGAAESAPAKSNGRHD